LFKFFFFQSYLQTSGEASYVYDKTIAKNELHGAFILSEIANCRLDQIDTSIAEKMSGVHKIILAKDIPGRNSFMPSPAYVEQVFCDDYIDYAGQSIGLVVAETFQQAQLAAKAVKITYKEIKQPILNVFDAIKAKSFFDKPTDDFVYGNAEQVIKNSVNVVQNDFYLDTQYHFHMENHVAISEPYENGFK
jgi:xanthine dehydrogenase molybdopterin-binding subunit B